MRSYSFFAILLLCIAIVSIDAVTFYWLQSIIKWIPSATTQLFINILYWICTIGLYTESYVFKIIIGKVPVTRRQPIISSLYGLTISSFIPKIIFVIIVSILYFSNYIFSDTESIWIVPTIGLIAGFLPFFVIAYAIFKAVYKFKVERIIVNHKDLPKSFDGLKIVQISDLHLGSFNYRYPKIGRAVRIINELDADVIFFTGDLVNNFAWELNGWEKVLDKLSAKKAKYAILGNHDYGDYSDWESAEEKKENFEKIKSFYDKIDFKLLLNQAELLFNDNQNIAIVGVENWGLPPFRQDGNLNKALKTVKDVPFKILLSHDPTHWSEEVIGQTDITLNLFEHPLELKAGIIIMENQGRLIKKNTNNWQELNKKQNKNHK